jgi:hypothetical protein
MADSKATHIAARLESAQPGVDGTSNMDKVKLGDVVRWTLSLYL